MPEPTIGGDQLTLADEAPEDWQRATGERPVRPAPAVHVDAVPAADPDVDIHTYFSLSYSTHKVLERSLMQSMPERWQHAMVRLLSELDDAYDYDVEYRVESGKWVYVDELSREDMERLGYRRTGMDCDQVVYSNGSEEVRTSSADRVFVPGPNPVPHYNRGRTYVAPRLPKSA